MELLGSIWADLSEPTTVETLVRVLLIPATVALLLAWLWHSSVRTPRSYVRIPEKTPEQRAMESLNARLMQGDIDPSDYRRTIEALGR